GEAHAEINAIGDALNSGHLSQNIRHETQDIVLYITLEPCSHTSKRTPPCTDAIIASGITKVVFAMNDPNPLTCGKGVKKLREAGIEVIGPTDQKQGERLNKRYIDNISKPSFVAIKMAMSADGKTATSAGDSKWITGEEARKYVLKLRSEFDGIMAGAGTVRTDNPRLTVRTKGKADPYRIIVDGNFTIPLDSKVLQNNDGKTIIVTSENAKKTKSKKIKQIENSKNALVISCESDKNNNIDMRKLIQTLGAMGIKRIMIEGGSELNASAINAGIVNRFYLFIAPKIIGGKNATSVVGGTGIRMMKDAKQMRLDKIKKIAGDLLLEFELPV
ncbi:MAG: bifunctional diaminohydroxyphosphoribosylaminopyrimidine deaminase/5-amino-6-(5-phosphoribosylamino)uracil reductase RibD, partial [Candidatus Micrarchaeota archaeon]